jgi:integrase/recombinase XerC
LNSPHKNATVATRRVPAETPLPASVQVYLDYLYHDRHLSPHTFSSYTHDLRRLFELLDDTSLAGMDAQQVRRCVMQLHSKGFSGKSLARMLSAWRGFFAYWVQAGELKNNPCVGLRAPKSPRALPNVLSPDEAIHLVQLPTQQDPLALRDKAMYELCYSSGLRLEELVQVNLADAERILQEGEVRVQGKGNKIRIVPVGKFAKTALQDWLKVRDLLLQSPQTALFLGRNGTRLTPRSVQLRLQAWGIKQGMLSHIHPHLLRHCFASHLLQSSSDLRAVQELLGHASLSTTQIYTHLDFQHLSTTYDQTHPRAKRKKVTPP